MKLSVNSAIQVLGLAAQATMATMQLFPSPAVQRWAAIATAVIQATSGILAHFSNPDGTPAQVAYVPGEKR